ncbi:MAG: hypothetical protein JOY68_04405, partial [Candidatus Dormibacteraeota bacterium]|nr:hypothetical protein [Candidatus Dormibacteraeota bacterium]
DSLLYQYGDVESVLPNWDSVIESSGTQLVLFDTGTPLANVMLQSPRWQKVYQDPLSIAFVRTETAASLGLPPQPSSYPAGDVCAQLKTSNVNSSSQQ